MDTSVCGRGAAYNGMLTLTDGWFRITDENHPEMSALKQRHAF